MSLSFAPLIPLPAIWALVLLAVVVGAFALWRALAGWALRALALLALAAVLAGPEWLRRETQALDDIVILIEDRTASQSLPGRPEQMDGAADAIARDIEALPGTQLRRVLLGDDVDGTRLATALNRALAAEPAGRVAGVILLTDGRAHDAGALPSDAPAPVHTLLTGQPGDWDRRLVIEEAPGYGIIGQPVDVILRVEDQGAVPAALAGQPVTLHVGMDGADERMVTLPPGMSFTLPVTPAHGGANVVSLRIDPAPGQLSARNDAAALTIMGVRDRLRVLLVSGEPHAGERSWRNLLKSDASVDLIHFTILRPPEKFDGVPADEMALIAFPVDELFARRIMDFDLIILDRYRVRGILPPEYFANIRRYVEEGGAVLVAAGPEDVGVESLHFSALGPALPARPTGRLIEAPFRPELTDAGRRHPVTAGLPGAEAIPPGWGRWLRLIEAEPRAGAQVVMQGQGAPLLIFDRVGKGRVAQLMSDQFWLWGRGFEGGGPQQELLRRIAHWAMAEPELEEEALDATLLPQPGGEAVLRITRRTMQDSLPPLRLTAPDGSSREVVLAETAPGRHGADAPAPLEGLYRLEQGDLTRLVAVGPAAPREFEQTVADGTALAPLAEAAGGAVLHLSDGIPDLRAVRAGAAAYGMGVTGPWIGVTPRGVESVTGQSARPVMPLWGWLALIGALMLGGWLIEGGRLRNRQEGPAA